MKDMSGDAVVIGALALMGLGAIFDSWIPFIAGVIWFIVGTVEHRP